MIVVASGDATHSCVQLDGSCESDLAGVDKIHWVYDSGAHNVIVH